MPERVHRITTESARLGRELRALRSLAKLSQADMAMAIGMAKSTVQRAEVGEQWLGRAEVEAWLRRTDAADDVARRVLALTEAMHGASWAEAVAYDPAGHLQDVAARRDREARLTRIYELGLIPGLLQTVEYAHDAIPLTDPTGEMDHAAAQAARVDRRSVLFSGDRRFEFLIGESALRWSPGPNVMPAQLDRLAELADLPSVELAVLPVERRGAPSWHSFIYREPQDDGPAYVTLELLHHGPRIDEPEVVELYRKLWKQQWEASLVGDDVRVLLARLRERWVGLTPTS